MARCSFQPNPDKSSAEKLPVGSLKALVYEWSEAPYDLPDSVMAYVDEFLQLSEAKRNYSDMTTAYKIQYFYYRKCNNFPEVYRSSLHRLDAANLSGDSTQIKDAIYALGRTLFLNGSYYESLDYFLQLDSMNLSSDRRATLFYTMGQVYSMTQSGDNYKELISRYYDLAEEETRKPDFSNIEVKSYILFGRANLLIPYEDEDLFEFSELQPSRVDSLKQAIALLEEAVAILDNDIYNSALALSYAYLEQFQLSRAYEQKLLEKDADHPEKRKEANYIRALTRYREKKFEETIGYASENIELLLAADDLYHAQTNMKIIYYSYKSMGEMNKALHFLEKMRELEKDITKKEKQAQVIQNQIKYDVKLKDEQLKTEKIRNAGYRRSLIITLVGLFLLGGVLFRYLVLYGKKKAAYRELVRKSQEWAQAAVEYMPPYHSETATTSAGDDTTGVHDDTTVSNDDATNANDDTTDANDDTTDANDDTTDAEQSANENDQLIFEQFQRLFQSENIYRDYAISIEKVAHKMNVNKNYLSRAINRCTRKNFSLYTNEYRVKDAVLILSNHPEKFSLEGLAFEVGFNDRKTFYNAFKKITGISPSDFRENLGKK